MSVQPEKKEVMWRWVDPKGKHHHTYAVVSERLLGTTPLYVEYLGERETEGPNGELRTVLEVRRIELEWVPTRRSPRFVATE
jgi:hypothetical protein